MKDTKIKYDKSIVKSLLFGAIALSIFCVIFIAPIFIPAKYIPPKFESNWLLVISLIAVYSIFPLIWLWLSYFSGKSYLKKLEEVGYEVPYNRKDYGNLLVNLPTTREIDPQDQGRDRNSLYLACLTIAGMVIILLFGLDYWLKWRLLSDTIGFMLICIVILAGLWAIGAYTYYRKSDNTKYRDFYIIDSRKERKTFADGIGTLIIVGAISAFCVSCAFSMTQYVAKARISYDQEYISVWLDDISNFYAENMYCHEDEWPDSYQKFEDGTYFLEENWNEDMFVRMFMSNQGVGHIGELQDKLRARDGRLFIKYNDGSFEATYTYKWVYGKEETLVVPR